MLTKIVNIHNPNQGIVAIKQKDSNCSRFQFIIYHEGHFKILWDWIILALVIFTTIHIPYQASFTEFSGTILDYVNKTNKNNIDPIVIFSLLVDFMFIMDILINFRTTYVHSSTDEIERGQRKLAVHYLRTWFVIDLIAAIPFDWILYWKDFSSNRTSTLTGLLKSARLLRLFRVARRIDHYSEYGLAVLFLLLSLFTLIAHWLACVWNFIAKYEKDNPNSWARLTELELTHQQRNSTLPLVRMTASERYVASLYYVVSSLTSVGFGNIAATTESEQIFSIVIMLLGALMYATIFGNMVAIIQRLYSKASSFHEQMNILKEFMKFYKIPEELRTSIFNYVRREWSTADGIDLDTVLQKFPRCIQADLTYEIYKPVFVNVTPFNEATISCMRALSMKFKRMKLQVNHYAFRQGEEIQGLYILVKGSLEVLVDSELKTILVKDAVFGYDFVKQPINSKSNANVRATSLVEIHYILKEDMMEILKMYPKFAQSFCAKMHYGYDLNDEKEEGTWYTHAPKDKFHVTAIARKILNMPFIPRNQFSFAPIMTGDKPQKHKDGGSSSCRPNKESSQIKINQNCRSALMTIDNEKYNTRSYKGSRCDKAQSLPLLCHQSTLHYTDEKRPKSFCVNKLKPMYGGNCDNNCQDGDETPMHDGSCDNNCHDGDEKFKHGTTSSLSNTINTSKRVLHGSAENFVNTESQELFYLECNDRLTAVEKTVSLMRDNIDDKLSMILELLSKISKEHKFVVD